MAKTYIAVGIKTPRLGSRRLLHCSCAGARLHQAQSQHVKSSEECHDYQDTFGLAMDKPNQCVRICQKLRLKAVSFVAKISQDPTPEGRSRNRHEAEESEVHPNNARRNRNQMANYGKKPCAKDSACLISSQPLLGLLQFFRRQQHKTAILYDQCTSNESRC